MGDGVGAELNIRAGNVVSFKHQLDSGGASLLHDDISQCIAQSVTLIDELKRGSSVC